jgi:hypothetical protein
VPHTENYAFLAAFADGFFERLKYVAKNFRCAYPRVATWIGTRQQTSISRFLFVPHHSHISSS